MASRIQYRRDTASNWTSEDPVLASGEPGYETDSGNVKIGDGSTAWSSLSYSGGGGGGGSGTVTSVGTGTNLTGGPITTSGTINMSNDLADVNSVTAQTSTNLALVAGANVTLHADNDSGTADLTITSTNIIASQKLTSKIDAQTITDNGSVSGSQTIDASASSLHFYTISGGDINFSAISNASNGDHGRVIVKQPAGNDVAFQFDSSGSIQAFNGGGSSFLGGSQAEDRYAVFDWIYIDGVAIVTNVSAPLYN